MDNHQKAEFLIEDAEALQEQDLASSLEMLKEALKIAPDYPNLANKIFLRESSLKDLDKSRDRIQQLIGDGKFFAAFEVIKNLPYGYQFERKDEIQKELSDKFNEAEALVLGAKRLPKSEQLQAWTQLSKAAEIMPDLPGLAERIRHIEDSTLELKTSLESISQAIDRGSTKEAQDYLESLKKLYILNSDKLQDIQRKIDQKKHQRFIRLQGAIFGGLFIVLSIFYISYEYMAVSRATDKWETVDQLLSEGKYKEVELTAQLVLEDLSVVHIFAQSKKHELKQEIDRLLKSTAFTQAKKGYVLFEGKYVPKEGLEKAKRLKTLIDEAKNLFRQGKYISAIDHYQQALPLVHEVKSEDSESKIFDIESAIYDAKLAKLESLLRDADQMYQFSDYKNAIQSYGKALKFAKVYGISADQESIVDKTRSAITQSHLATIEKITRKGDKFLAAEKFHSAYEAYNAAVSYARKNKITNGKLLASLNRSRNIANISRLLAGGHKAFEEADWKKSFENYQQALELSTSTDLISVSGLQSARVNIKIADRNIKLALCKKLLKDADASFNKREYEKAQGLYEKIPAFIDANDLNKDADFSLLRATATQKIKDAGELVFAASKKEYLSKNYSSILRRHFNLNKKTAFLDPQIVLLSTKEKSLTFSISAVSYEKKGREVKKAKYELHYLYDIPQKRWAAVNKFMNMQKKMEDNLPF